MRAIAIDGPAGAGKSTIAKLVSHRLGYIYVDTGAMYRAIGLYMINKGISGTDENSIKNNLDGAQIELKYSNGVQEIYLCGENVTETIRNEKVGNMASSISVFACVRNRLVDMQRNIAIIHNVVMDGRDIGTCVLPHADVKIYLSASVRIRAERRFKELKEKNVACNLDSIMKDIAERDYRDMNRDNSPLKKADDAIEIDSSDMSIEEVADKIISIVQCRG